MADDITLSEGLTQLSELFAGYEHEPRVLDPEDARIIRRCIKALRIEARALEREAARPREDTLMRQLAEACRIAGEATRPGSNLVLFPPPARPLSEGAV